IYHGGIEAVKGVSIAIPDRALCVLVGPSGCGKSTLLRMIAGLETISAGSVSIDDKVVNAIGPTERDIAMVSRAPGVGKKVAERIVTELKNKAPAFAGAAAGTIGLKQELGEGVAPAPVADAVSALTNLGYSRDIAANAIAAAMKAAGEDADSAKLIRLGLKELAR
ncbi:ATP-binding cassette domain-containing protein, partial [Rhizobiaceae sp. 2RAB30]